MTFLTRPRSWISTSDEAPHQPYFGGLEADREGAAALYPLPAQMVRADGQAGRHGLPSRTKKGAVPERISFLPPKSRAAKLESRIFLVLFWGGPAKKGPRREGARQRNL